MILNHRKIKKPSIAVIATIVGVAQMSGLAQAQTTDIEKKYKATEVTGLVASIHDANLTIRSTDAKELTVKITNQKLSKGCTISVDKVETDVKITLSNTLPSLFWDCRADIAVELPENTTVKIDQKKGTQTVEGKFSQVTLNTNEGNISVTGQVEKLTVDSDAANVNVAYNEAPKKGSIIVDAISTNVKVTLPKDTVVQTDLPKRMTKITSDFESAKDAEFLVRVRASFSTVALNKSGE